MKAHGDSAFPLRDAISYANGERINCGMTLRDYFAAAWLSRFHGDAIATRQTAVDAYDMADYMLAERDK